LALAKSRAKIPLQKLHAVGVGGAPPGLDQPVVVLVRADEERRRERLKAVRRGEARRLVQAHLVTDAAAVVQIAGHRAHKIAKPVPIPAEKRHGPVPETGQLLSLRAQFVDALDGAGRAADVQERPHFSPPSFKALTR